MSLVGVDEALQLALGHAQARPPVVMALRDAFGTFVAAPVHARFDVPGADVSIMDGYALAAATAQASATPLRVIGESAAGHPWPHAVPSGAAVRISTGAVLPDGCDAVVMQEDTRRDGDAISIDADVRAALRSGQHVRPRGADVHAGATVADAGTGLGAAELALLGTSGHADLPVHRRPTVAILSTGDELVPVGHTPAIGQVVSTNGLMLATACRSAGAVIVGEQGIGDDPAAIVAAMAAAIAEADVVLISGGASVGDHDHVRAAVHACGLTPLLWGLALRPGKPTGIAATANGLLFALPGNPASAFVVFELLVRPVLRRMLGVRGAPRRPLQTMTAGDGFVGERTREHWVRARIDGARVLPLPDQRSGNLRSLAGADALVRVPIGCARLEPGAPCDVLVLGTAPHERAP